jgi:hypothetical protein
MVPQQPGNGRSQPKTKDNDDERPDHLPRGQGLPFLMLLDEMDDGEGEHEAEEAEAGNEEDEEEGVVLSMRHSPIRPYDQKGATPTLAPTQLLSHEQ